MTHLSNDHAGETKTTTTSYARDTELEISEDYLARRFSRIPRAPQDVVYEVTRDSALLHLYFSLREAMFFNNSSTRHVPGQRDAYDDVSDIMVARRGLQCVGGARLTISSPAQRRRLPMEQDDLSPAELFPQLDLEHVGYGELSRFAILPEFHDTAFSGILRGLIRRAIAEGMQYVFTVLPVSLASVYCESAQELGLRCNISHEIAVTQRDSYEGANMVIGVIDLSLQLRDYKASRKQKASAGVTD